MNVSGALFDMTKLLDVSKNVICKFSAEKIYEETLNWAEKYDVELKQLLEKDREYAVKVLNIERNNVKPRKDISKWSDVKNSINYMYEDEFNKLQEYEYQKITDKAEIKDICEMYVNKYYNENDSKDDWFGKIKDLAESMGYAREVKEYKQEPDKYKGHVGDISTVLRVTLTKHSNTPDLYEIMQVLGKEIVMKRLLLP
jgi:glutamyl-tRNA synthetase